MLRTSYSIIAETGPQGSVAWFAPDTPATSVYMPFDARSGGGIARPLMLGENKRFDRGSAWWAFNFVNNWMQLNYQGMSQEDVLPKRKAWQDRIDSERSTWSSKDGVDISSWQVNIQESLIADWWDLADLLVAKWNDMRRQGQPTTADPVDGTAYGYPEWWAKMIGFNHDPHPIWVQRSDKLLQDRGALAQKIQFPGVWDPSTRKWQGRLDDSEIQLQSQDPMWSPRSLIWTIVIGASLFASGFFLGQHRPLPNIDAQSLLG